MRKNDKTYKLMVSRMHEVATVPTQTLGPFTFIYKKLVPYLKFSLWRSTVIISFFATVFLYLLFGSALVRLASLLQFGF